METSHVVIKTRSINVAVCGYKSSSSSRNQIQTRKGKGQKHVGHRERDRGVETVRRRRRRKGERERRRREGTHHSSRINKPREEVVNEKKAGRCGDRGRQKARRRTAYFSPRMAAAAAPHIHRRAEATETHPPVRAVPSWGTTDPPRYNYPQHKTRTLPSLSGLFFIYSFFLLVVILL